MRRFNAFASLIFVIIVAIGCGIAYSSYNGQADTAGTMGMIIVTFIITIIVSSAIKIADQWEKAVVLCLGNFRAIRGPGLFFIIPVIDAIPYWIDTHVITTTFKTEKTLTKDTVLVDVDAVLFWKVLDQKKASLDVADY
jgi:regulator of protease activity HflC (stomatin/prohibitin superfamily)